MPAHVRKLHLVGLIVALGLPTGPLLSQSLCEQLHGLQPGQSIVQHEFAPHVQVGVGWLRSPEGWTESGGGPIREIGLNVDRLAARRECTEEGDYVVDLRSGGMRFGIAAADGYWSDALRVSAHAGYLNAGPSLRYWIAPEISGLGISTDTVGLALGANVGAGIFEWVAITLRPAYVVTARGYDKGFTFVGGLSISPGFRREVLGDDGDDAEE